MSAPRMSTLEYYRRLLANREWYQAQARELEAHAADVLAQSDRATDEVHRISRELASLQVAGS